MFTSILGVLQIQHLDFFFFKACVTLKGLNTAVYQYQSGAWEGVLFKSIFDEDL